MIPLPSLTDSLASIAIALDNASFDARLNWMHGLSRKQLRALYRLADGGPTLRVDHFYGNAGEMVIHHGQNSLPAFCRFQKRVCRRTNAVQGYNHQATSWLTGPGHFTVAQDGSEVLFDYTVLPTDVPPDFPDLAANDRGVSRFVYGGMIDRVRRVSQDCVIGAAYRGEKAVGAWFMLTRDTVAVSGVEE